MQKDEVYVRVGATEHRYAVLDAHRAVPIAAASERAPHTRSLMTQAYDVQYDLLLNPDRTILNARKRGLPLAKVPCACPPARRPFCSASCVRAPDRQGLPSRSAP